MSTMRRAVLASLAVPALGQNGIAKVLEMLAGMKEKSLKEAQAEKIQFKKYETWCGSTVTELKAEIAQTEIAIQEFEAARQTGLAKAGDLAEDIAKNNAEIAEKNQQITTEEKSRAEDAAAWRKVKAEFESNIAAVRKAAEVLKGQKSVSQLQMKPALLEVASGLTGRAKELAVMLIEQAPAAASYENQSSGVVGMLEDLAEKFQEELNVASLEENKKAGASATLVTNLRGQVENVEADKRRSSQAKAAAEGAAGKAAREKAGAEKVLATDKESHGTVSANCKTKAAEFGQRSGLRAEEEKALSEAVSIIEGIKDKKTAVGFVQDTSFLQTGSFLAQGRAPVDSAHLEKVAGYLRRSGESQGSKRLQLLSLEVSAGGPFDKILGLIRTLIDRLKDEGMKEAGKNGQCSKWIKENKMDISDSQEKLDGLAASIEELSAQIGEASQRLKTLNTQAQESQKMLAEAGVQRQADKKENAFTVKDAKEGEEACGQALKVLSDFYSKAADATALLQQVPTNDAPEIFDKPFNADQSMGNGVIGMMEFIQSDFLKLRSETEAQESADQKAHDKFVDDEAVAKSARDEEIAHTKQQRAGDEKDLNNAKNDLDSEKQVMSAAVDQKRVIEQDKGCVAFAGKSPDELFKERFEAREEEIKSLMMAKELLAAP